MSSRPRGGLLDEAVEDLVDDEFDILVTTDVLGQGVNLQQPRNVINYDLPWNPMRVVQRNGRIDRVNSPHSDIYPHSFFPEDRLDDLLDLEYRLREKLTQAGRSVGIDTEVIPEMETVDQNFADKGRDIEAIYNEDSGAYEQEGGSTDEWCRYSRCLPAAGRGLIRPASSEWVAMNDGSGSETIFRDLRSAHRSERSLNGRLESGSDDYSADSRFRIILLQRRDGNYRL